MCGKRSTFCHANEPTTDTTRPLDAKEPRCKHGESFRKHHASSKRSHSRKNQQSRESAFSIHASSATLAPPARGARAGPGDLRRRLRRAFLIAVTLIRCPFWERNTLAAR